MSIKIIVATDEQGAIGNNNKLLVDNKEEMLHFKNVTEGNIVIMGNNTFKSLGSLPLKNRMNIVIATEYQRLSVVYRFVDNLIFVKDIREAISIAKTLSVRKATLNKEIYVIGGQQVYQAALDTGLVTEIIQSVFNLKVAKFDKKFPTIPKEFSLFRTVFTGAGYSIRYYYSK